MRFTEVDVRPPGGTDRRGRHRRAPEQAVEQARLREVLGEDAYEPGGAHTENVPRTLEEPAS
ncbi:hypothetical protein [Streptomyces sp. NPDC058086]|uniref:hypothetical protein n=1 Tax=Streptomyces sp. NPDC058086 TaxID=3346334 RepID=UPI0036EF3E2A